ncbi:conserved hypothetical protein [Acidianus hospitalis W1]|uniref:Thermopsin n=1 Tax=Acidianus hospitalis (strain W1) TaxID=933801 RepID=F4B6G6_ACIHW|nr:hypothetical protein [Acidianus hospitalis]AEE94586.1 conserved hypothetical protein [Acidianus hospitalis W1]
MKVLFLLVILIIFIPTVYAGYDYGYEFGYVQTCGIQSIVSLYNISLEPGSPGISIQENVCLNINGSNVFVQNVIEPVMLTRYGYDVIWTTSVYYDGAYHMFCHSGIIGYTFNITTIWTNTSNALCIEFFISNTTLTLNKTCVIMGKFFGIIYSGYNAGTVIGGYGNSAVAELAKGFNVSIREYYRYNNNWYVPPVAYSGVWSTGESAINGYAYFSKGTVWITYGNAGIQELYNFSVVIVNNTVYTFPRGSLWIANGRFFVNFTPLENVTIRPFYYFNYSFIPKKEILISFDNYTEIDCVKSKSFYLPFPEVVYFYENGSCVGKFISTNITYIASMVQSSYTKSIAHTINVNKTDKIAIVIIGILFITLIFLLFRKRYL